MATPDSAFVESSEKLTAANPKETLVAQLNADIKRLRDLCWEMRAFSAKFSEAKRSAISGAMDEKGLNAILALQNEFTNRERDILVLRRSVEERAETYNCGRDERERIYIAHTCEGLPIKAETTRKTPIWGS